MSVCFGSVPNMFNSVLNMTAMIMQSYCSFLYIFTGILLEKASIDRYSANDT